MPQQNFEDSRHGVGKPTAGTSQFSLNIAAKLVWREKLGDLTYDHTTVPVYNRGDLRNLQFVWSFDAKYSAAVASAIWQVARFPFIASLKKWQSPAGLVGHGPAPKDAAAGSAWGQFAVDFTQIILGPVLVSQMFRLVMEEQRGRGAEEATHTLSPVLKANASAILAATIKQPPQKPLDIVESKDLDKPGLVIQRGKYRAKLVTNKYYIRVVLLDAKGNSVGQSTPVVVDMVPLLKPAPPMTPKPLASEYPNHMRFISFDPPRAQENDAGYAFVVAKWPPPDPIFGKIQADIYNVTGLGQKFYYVPQPDDDSWFEDALEAVGDAVTTVAEWVEDAVDWVSTAYEDIKNAVVDVASFLVANLPGFPPELKDEVKGILSTALDTSLAAMGLPPSIPNFDQLAEMGKGYVVEFVAKQANIPPELANDMRGIAEKMVDELASQARHTAQGGDNPLLWFAPDPDFLARPAGVILEVANTRDKPTEWQHTILYDSKHVFKSSNMIDIPPLDPGQVLRIPVFLEQTSGPPSATSAAYAFSAFMGGWPTSYEVTLEGAANAQYRAPQASAPAVASWAPNRLDILAVADDNALYHHWWDNGWGQWSDLGGNLISTPCVVAWAPGRLDVFAVGADHTLQHWWWQGQWGGPESLGGSLAAAPPVAVSWAPGRLDVFALAQDTSLMHWWYDNGWDSDSLGGSYTTAPTAVTWGPGRLDVFGLGQNRTLYHTWWDNTNWQWEGRDGPFVSPPTAISRIPGVISVYAMGRERGVHQRFWDNGRQGSGYQAGLLSSPPCATSWGPNNETVCGRGDDGAVWVQIWNGQNWGGWFPLGGQIISPPRIVSWGPNRLDIFAVAEDNGMWHRGGDGTNWSDWYALGGKFI